MTLVLVGKFNKINTISPLAKKGWSGKVVFCVMSSHWALLTVYLSCVRQATGCDTWPSMRSWTLAFSSPCTTCMKDAAAFAELTSNSGP